MKRMNQPHRRERRHEEALVRQQEYDKLTDAQKIKRAEARRGQSKKELARLRGDDNG